MSEEYSLKRRFWLFFGQTYYACGGMKDFVNSFDTKEQAEQKLKEHMDSPEYQWYQILDTQDETISGSGVAMSGLGGYV